MFSKKKKKNDNNNETTHWEQLIKEFPNAKRDCVL